MYLLLLILYDGLDRARYLLSVRVDNLTLTVKTSDNTTICSDFTVESHAATTRKVKDSNPLVETHQNVAHQWLHCSLGLQG